MQVRRSFHARLHLSQVAGAETGGFSAQFSCQASQTRFIPAREKQMRTLLGEATAKRRTYPSASSKDHI
jgi:hypothetical protein